MSSWGEIVRYRANMEAVFNLTCDPIVLGSGKLLKERKRINPKTHCCGILSSTL
jgi:hypothetical protein